MKKLENCPNRWVQDLVGIGGLGYIVLKNVPMRSSETGPVVEMNLGLLEHLVAKALIAERLPLRGCEVRFLRKTLGLSMESFSEQLGLTSGAIFKWEQKPEQRLHPINEVAVRALVADHLGLEISGKFSDLLGEGQTPNELVILAG